MLFYVAPTPILYIVLLMNKYSICIKRNGSLISSGTWLIFPNSWHKNLNLLDWWYSYPDILQRKPNSILFVVYGQHKYCHTSGRRHGYVHPTQLSVGDCLQAVIKINEVALIICSRIPKTYTWEPVRYRIISVHVWYSSNYLSAIFASWFATV